MTVHQRPIPIKADPAALHAGTIRSLARALIAYAIAEKTRGTARAETVLRARFEGDQLAGVILKAATSPITLTGTPSLAQVDLVDDLLTLVGRISAAAQVLQAGLMLRFGRDAQVSVPLLETNASKVTFVAENAPIPVQAFSMLLASMSPHKLAAILVLTAEMLAGSNAEVLVTEVLRRSVGLSLDNALFDSVAASSARPAGLRNGISALGATPSGGGGLDVMLADLALLAAAVAPIGPPIFVASPERAAKIKALAFGQLAYRVFGSPGVAQTDLIAIAENGVASALGQPTFDSSRTAALQLDTAPAADLMTGVPVKSLWQTDSVAIKLWLDVSWIRRDTRAVAWTTPNW
jgi:Phage capsid family